MRSGTNNKWLAVVLCLFTAAAVQAQPEAVPWDPNEHLAAHWNSVSLTSRLYNPAEQPDQQTSIDRSLSVSGEIDILDVTGLIGLATMPAQAAVFDQDGNEIYRTPSEYSRFRFYRPPRTRPTLGEGGIVFDLWSEHFGLTIPIDPNVGYPSQLSRIEYSIGVLVAEATETVDVPFATGVEWIELVPGLRILIEEASTSDGVYRYRTQFEYDPNLVSYNSGLTFRLGDENVPPMALISVEVLDANGVSVTERSSGGAFTGGSSSSSSGGLVTGTSTMTGNCSACGEAAIIRYNFAAGLYDQEVLFILENIPVPTF